MKSASCRANACTLWSSRRTSCSICVRNSVFMLSLVNCTFSSPTAPAGSRKIRAIAAPTPLFDRCFHNRIVIFCERYIGAVRFEEVLVNVEAWAKRFECCFQPLHCVLLFRAVQTFVVHAGNAQNHA